MKTIRYIALLVLLAGCGASSDDQAAANQNTIDSLKLANRTLSGIVGVLTHEVDSLSGNNRVPLNRKVDEDGSDANIEKLTADNSFGAYKRQWESIRRSPEKMVGKSFQWLAKVWRYGSGEVIFERPGTDDYLIKISNLSVEATPLHYQDWVLFTATFKVVDKTGALVFDNPSALRNLGYGYHEPD